MTHIHNNYDNPMIEKIMHDINALLIIKRISEKFYVKNETNISKHLQSVKKILKKKFEKLKPKFHFKLNNVLKSIITIININFLIIINISVITATTKTDKQPPPPKKRTWTQTVVQKNLFSFGFNLNENYNLMQNKKKISKKSLLKFPFKTSKSSSLLKFQLKNLILVKCET